MKEKQLASRMRTGMGVDNSQTIISLEVQLTASPTTLLDHPLADWALLNWLLLGWYWCWCWWVGFTPGNRKNDQQSQ